MALNQQRLGFRYAPYRYEVGRETVRAYAAATQVSDVRYDAAGVVEPATTLAVPPAFVACVAGARAWTMILEDDELGAHDRMMQVGQEFAFDRPVYVGDVLICTPQITDLRSIRGLELLTLEGACATPAGAAVVTSRSRLVFFAEAAA